MLVQVVVFVLQDQIPILEQRLTQSFSELSTDISLLKHIAIYTPPILKL
jgi:hypothetical protein